MDLFYGKTADYGKLINFGFTDKGGKLFYRTPIMDGQFELRVEIVKDGGIKTEVIDTATGEPYTLHLVESAGGAFVGAVRGEYRQKLEEIAQKCYRNDVFKSQNARGLISYAAEKYGGELEFLWSDLPDAAILRRSDSKKWYAVFMVVERRRLGVGKDGKAEIADLHAEPPDIEKLVDGKRFLPGYHMNKKHWITVLLDGDAALNELCAMLDKSYALAKK